MFEYAGIGYAGEVGGWAYITTEGADLYGIAPLPEMQTPDPGGRAVL